MSRTLPRRAAANSARAARIVTTVAVSCAAAVSSGAVGDGLSAHQAQEPMEEYVSPSPTARELAPASLALTEDGRSLIFSTREGKASIVETRSGNKVPFPDGFPHLPGERAAAVWSPDGSRLAYLKYRGGKGAPVIWEQASGSAPVEADRPACSGGCRFWSPVWTRDGRSLLYVAEPQVAVGAFDVASESAASIPDQQYGRSRAPGGVFVMQSDPARREFGRASQTLVGDVTDGCVAECQPSEIVALDPRTSTSTTLAKGAPFKGIFAADNGKFAVVAVRVQPATRGGGRYYSYYYLPLVENQKARTPKSGAQGGGGPTDGHGNPLRLLAADVPHFQVGSSISVSPSGKYMAYTTTGNYATGDVYLVEIATGRVTNLTASVELPPNPYDSHPRKNVIGARRLGDSVGKFGSTYLAPIWTNDERAVLVARPRLEGSLRHQLWRVPISAGRAEPIFSDGTFSIEAIGQCQGGHSSCRFGPERAILAVLRMRQPDGADQLVVGAIDDKNGRVRVVRRVGAIDSHNDVGKRGYEDAAFDGAFVISRDGSLAVAALRPTDAAPELWRVSLDEKYKAVAEPLNVLQDRHVPAIVTKRVDFTSSTGDRLAARVELPPDYRDGQRLPAVMHVYGSRYQSNGPQFNGGYQWYAPLRDARYALILPDLPAVPTENGKNCDYMASNALAALDAVARAGFVDPSRVAVMGHSWGGYSVFCIVSRTNRFKAALSGAGPSNLFGLGIMGAGRSGALYGLAGLTQDPWDQPQWYVEESPGFRLNKIVTPLMIVYGVKDSVQPNHAIEMFSGLSSLGRHVQLIGYDDSGHAEMLYYKDYWRRTFEWFDHYLGVTQEEKAARLPPAP